MVGGLYMSTCECVGGCAYAWVHSCVGRWMAAFMLWVDMCGVCVFVCEGWAVVTCVCIDMPDVLALVGLSRNFICLGLSQRRSTEQIVSIGMT